MSDGRELWGLMTSAVGKHPPSGKVNNNLETSDLIRLNVHFKVVKLINV